MSQGQSNATTKFLQLEEFQWTIGSSQSCVQRARTQQFCVANLLCTIRRRKDPPVDFLYSGGGLLSQWAPDRRTRRRLRVFWPISQDLWVAIRTPRTPLLCPSRPWRTWATTVDRRPTAIMNIIRVSRTGSPWTLTITSLIWTEWELLERTPPNLNTHTRMATDSTDITTEITCKLHLRAQVNEEIITGCVLFCISPVCIMWSTPTLNLITCFPLAWSGWTFFKKRYPS